MSALLARMYSDRIELAADGGTFQPDGTLIGLKQKLWIAPNIPLVVGGVGGNTELEMLMRVVEMATRSGSVDKAIEWLIQILPDRREVAAAIPFKLVIACISETWGPQLWLWRNVQPGDTEIPQLKQSSSVVALGPALTSDEMLAAGYDHDDFRATALGLMGAMRAKKCRPAFLDGLDVDEGHYVAGHVDHAMVTAAGVIIQRICEWPDVVGERVKPGLGRVLPKEYEPGDTVSVDLTDIADLSDPHIVINDDGSVLVTDDD